MDTKIKPSFWSDESIGELDPHQKLAALWILTNPNVSLLGVSKVSRRQFLFETGLPLLVLENTCKAMPRAFHLQDGHVVALKYIHYQFGSGQNLLKNKIFRTISAQFSCLKQPWLRSLIVENCPELHPHTNPFEGVREGEGEGEGAGAGVRAEGGAGGSFEKKTAAPVEPAELVDTAVDVKLREWAERWEGEMASGTPKIDPAYLSRFIKKMTARSFPVANPIAYLRSCWMEDWKQFDKNNPDALFQKNGRAEFGETDKKRPVVSSTDMLAVMKGVCV